MCEHPAILLAHTQQYIHVVHTRDAACGCEETHTYTAPTCCSSPTAQSGEHYETDPHRWRADAGRRYLALSNPRTNPNGGQKKIGAPIIHIRTSVSAAPPCRDHGRVQHKQDLHTRLRQATGGQRVQHGNTRLMTRRTSLLTNRRQPRAISHVLRSTDARGRAAATKVPCCRYA